MSTFPSCLCNTLEYLFIYVPNLREDGTLSVTTIYVKNTRRSNYMYINRVDVNFNVNARFAAVFQTF